MNYAVEIMSTQKCLHQKKITVAWGDMDALNHVNHARYFEYFQEARIEWLSELHLDLKKSTGPVLIHAECTFKAPIIYPAEITIHSYLNSLGRTSLTLDHIIYKESQLMAQGSCKIVWIDYLKNKAVPLPEAFVAALQSL